MASSYETANTWRMNMGEMADWQIDQFDIPSEDSEPCEVCHGSGKVGRKKCVACGGTGYDN